MSGRERLGPAPAGTSAQPWYREKLPSKSLRRGKGRLLFPDALNSRGWKFLEGGVPEGRGPRPPDGIVRRAFLPPLVRHGPSPAAPTPGPARGKVREKMSEASARASKLSAFQRARRADVGQLERRLARHPLAHYSHLEGHVSPELFAQVLELLDPEKKLPKEWAQRSQGRRVWPESAPRQKTAVRLPARPKRTPPQNPYRRLSEGKKTAEDAAYGSPPLDENGGAENLQDESAIRNLFVPGYDVPRSFPTRVVELDNVPEELKRRLGPRLPGPAAAGPARGKSQDPYRPGSEKIRYGAWYLSPKLWKKQRADEPLKDPKVELAAQEEELRKAPQEKDYQILELHGIMAFMEFIESKGYRMPNFLSKILAQKELKEASEATSQRSPERPRYKKRKSRTSPRPKA
ncbi:protein FAM47E isoform X2 [Tachyglossus aculeatus]|uniref:protein FAM47E isoform X2 n=1 Tax=Tachyglossus aculeatus TaxID=9261 RepID=UPI0018F70B65|nr:protein FAM47E isoform X2 [Tachyglossus aculeatus]